MNGWDGGWEEAIDSGEGLEDVALGPVHLYGRAANSQPAPRWGTRHELVSRRHADHADAAEGDRGEHRGAGTPQRPKRRKTRGRKAASSRRSDSRGTRRARRRHELPFHLRVGIEEEEVRAFEALLDQAKQKLPRALSGRERKARVAARLGLTARQLDYYSTVRSRRDATSLDVGSMILHTLSRHGRLPERVGTATRRRRSGAVEINGLPVRFVASPPVSGKRREGSGRAGGGGGGPIVPLPRSTPRGPTAPAKRSSRSEGRSRGEAPRSAPTIPTCGACGVPISVNGFCGCS